MSETVRYKGKIKKIASFKDKEEIAKCELIKREKSEDLEYYDSYVEKLCDCFYQEYIEVNEELYQVIEKEDLDMEYDVFESNKNSDETIDFHVMYYNGGCGFAQAIEYALKGDK